MQGGQKGNIIGGHPCSRLLLQMNRCGTVDRAYRWFEVRHVRTRLANHLCIALRVDSCGANSSDEQSRPFYQGAILPSVPSAANLLDFTPPR